MIIVTKMKITGHIGEGDEVRFRDEEVWTFEASRTVNKDSMMVIYRFRFADRRDRH